MNDTSVPPVSLFRLFWKMGGWIVIVFGAILLIFTLISQMSLSAAKRFEAEGVPATAVVTQKYYTESIDSDGDRSVTYWLTLNFVTQNKQDITVTESVSSSEYARGEVGEAFELVYLQSEPEWVELTPGSYATGAKVAQIGALVAFLPLGGFFASLVGGEQQL